MRRKAYKMLLVSAELKLNFKKIVCVAYSPHSYQLAELEIRLYYLRIFALIGSYDLFSSNLYERAG